MSGYSTLGDPARGRYPQTDIVAEIAAARDAADSAEHRYVGDADTPIGFEKRLLNLLFQLGEGQISVEECQRQAQDWWALCMEEDAAYE